MSWPEMSESLVDRAAPVAGTLVEPREIGLAIDQDDGASRLETHQPPYAAHRPSIHKPWITNGGRAISRRLDQEEDFRMSTASDPFSLQSEILSIAPKLPDPTLRVAQSNPVEQFETAESKDCPFQRLQDKLRLHNSTDPRPSRLAPKQAAVNRGSVSTMLTSTTYPSPHTSSRFSFGLLLQPSLDFFKFRDIRTSLGGRGSGWSLWFRQDDTSNGKPKHPEVETK